MNIDVLCATRDLIMLMRERYAGPPATPKRITSALERLTQVASAAGLELPAVAATSTIENEDDQVEAIQALRQWARRMWQRELVDFEKAFRRLRCECFRNGPPDYNCTTCAGIGCALPETTR